MSTPFLSALVYTGISLALAGAFILASTLLSGYPLVARLGGAAWVFLLSMIVSMPLVIPYIKKKRR